MALRGQPQGPLSVGRLGDAWGQACSRPNHSTAEAQTVSRSHPGAFVVRSAAASQKSWGSTSRALAMDKRRPGQPRWAPRWLNHYQTDQRKSKTAHAALIKSGLLSWRTRLDGTFGFHNLTRAHSVSKLVAKRKGLRGAPAVPLVWSPSLTACPRLDSLPLCHLHGVLTQEGILKEERCAVPETQSGSVQSHPASIELVLTGSSPARAGC